MLRLHDTALGTVRELELREPGRVSVYVCGPTVYDVPHTGHGRSYLVYDVLVRFLRWSGLEVTHVRNITDIEDKIITRANELGVDPDDLTRQNEATYYDAFDRLGILRPDHDPHATAYVGEMLDLVSQLEGRGVAYETADGVYLDVGKIPDYGLLAQQDLEDLRSGSRVEANEDKRSPLDFVLWKKSKPDEPSWPSPWGPGRPGWHTECVVMSLDLLGDGFDLHAGGLDLKFPHHENERAQAIALGHTFARHWMHHAFVEVEGVKMSKSLKNFTSLLDLLDRHDARAYRVLVLRSHYRSPMEVTPATIADAEKALERLDSFGRRFLASPEDAGGLDEVAVAEFVRVMEDDLQTPQAMAQVFDLVSRANAAADSGDTETARRLSATVSHLTGALGLELNTASGEVDDATKALMAERDAARAAKDFTRADALRDQLQSLGWTVEDTAGGTRVHR